MAEETTETTVDYENDLEAADLMGAADEEPEGVEEVEDGVEA